MTSHSFLRTFASILALAGCPAMMHAQTWETSSVSTRMGVTEERADMAEASWTSGLKLRNVGPSVMGGRVVTLPLWRTPCTWRTRQVGFGKASTTALRLNLCWTKPACSGRWPHPSGRVVVGSGEVNSSRSSYAGDGGGERRPREDAPWGLEEATTLQGHHRRVNPDRMWVVALGNCIPPTAEGQCTARRTAGETLPTVPGCEEVVGFVHLVADGPTRTTCSLLLGTGLAAPDFTEGGVGTGIWESPMTDTWTLPTGIRLSRRTRSWPHWPRLPLQKRNPPCACGQPSPPCGRRKHRRGSVLGGRRFRR